MWEWIVGVWIGFWGLWITWPALCAIFFWGIWGELDDGLIVNAASTILLSFLFWNTFDIPAVWIPYVEWTVAAYWIYLILFFPIGFVWSFRRYKIHATKCVAKNAGRLTKEEMRRELEIKNNLDRVISWVLSWPVSMISRVFEDIIFTLKDIVMTLCKNIFNRILEKALKLIPDSDYRKDYANVSNDSNGGRL